MKNTSNWNNFIEEFTQDILPIYKDHEDTFDDIGIHGRMHISRSLIFAEYMARFYESVLGQDINFSAIRYAVAFHDSGRKGNGIDLWEDVSEKKCFQYLMTNEKSDYSIPRQKDINFNRYTASLINKNINSAIIGLRLDFNKLSVYDADVLEIMRPCCGNGERDGFRPNFLHFLKFDDEYQYVRNDLIEDAWKLIEYTEDNKHLITDNHLIRIIDILEKNKNDYRVLKDLF